MSHEPDEKRQVISHLETVRGAVRNAEMEPTDRAEMESALAALEQELQVARPADPASLVTLLRAWEVRLEAEHPVLAGVVSDTLQKLSAMGI